MVDKRTTLALFFLVFFCYSYLLPTVGYRPGGGANANSRLALIASVVERHRLDIDAYERLTRDKAWYHGQYYSDKAIGTAVLGVPVYAAYRELRGFEHFSLRPRSPRNPLYPLTVAVVALPSAVLSALLYQLARLMAAGRAWALLLTLLYAFGTLAFPFSTVFFGHQVAAAFSFAAFYVLVRARFGASRGPTSARSLLAAGALAGMAVLVEYPVALVAVLLFFYAATFARRGLGLYVLGGVPAATLLLAYNWHTLGGPLSFAYDHVSDPKFASMRTGFFGITQPRWSSFVEITLGPRGLLRQSVFLWFLPLGVWRMCRTPRWRRECALCVAVGLAFLVWNSGYYLPLGGSTPGPRFLVPSLPFLIVPLAFLARETGVPPRLTKAGVLLAGAWSVGLYSLACATNPLAPVQFADPVCDYWLPLIAHGHLRLNLGGLVFGLRGVESLAPLAAVFAVGLAALALLGRAPRFGRVRGAEEA